MSNGVPQMETPEQWCLEFERERVRGDLTLIHAVSGNQDSPAKSNGDAIGRRVERRVKPFSADTSVLGGSLERE